MEPLSSKNRNVEYIYILVFVNIYICAIDLFSKYASIKPLKDKKKAKTIFML